ncbi:MAG: GNAT family N-acetyltransferase [Prochlorococcaceae cyanobacterium]
MAALEARWHQGIAELNEAQWDGLLARASGRDQPLPFYRWRWLAALELSGSIVPEQGWQSCPLTLWRGEQLVAVAPLYLKGHSYGEFVFDQSFADLAARLGQRYYPKLVGMSPVSPIEGYRFWIDPAEDQAALTAVLFEQIDRFCDQHGIFSSNLLYVDPAWAPLAEAAGCSRWLNQQSTWSNPGFAGFDDYLASFNANQRRNIKRERRAIEAAGLVVTPLAGEAIAPVLVNRMHEFYAMHCARWGPWGSKYLTQDFFVAAARDLRENLVLFAAHPSGEDPSDPLAMSLCVRGGDQLWGRYWGSAVELENLHFEVCYYAPIAWAIEQGIRSFDPGAGGSHKRRRGFVAQPRISLHRWSDERFAEILRQWLPGANQQMALQIEAINAELPFTAAYDPPHASAPEP